MVVRDLEIDNFLLGRAYQMKCIFWLFLWELKNSGTFRNKTESYIIWTNTSYNIKKKGLIREESILLACYNILMLLAVSHGFSANLLGIISLISVLHFRTHNMYSPTAASILNQATKYTPGKLDNMAQWRWVSDLRNKATYFSIICWF